RREKIAFGRRRRKLKSGSATGRRSAAGDTAGNLQCRTTADFEDVAAERATSGREVERFAWFAWRGMLARRALLLLLAATDVNQFA
ncbi:MAG: hypothetical protein KGJ45_11515, partial [Elusimicrobia bacterium]|nr:hypothetical protein [Elusimicrobiota bacterium]